jgi:hypothetical protein
MVGTLGVNVNVGRGVLVGNGVALGCGVSDGNAGVFVKARVGVAVGALNGRLQDDATSNSAKLKSKNLCFIRSPLENISSIL